MTPFISLAVAYGVGAMSPLLFMDPSIDVHDVWGMVLPVSNPVRRAAPRYVPPPERYDWGATVLGAFTCQPPQLATYEVYVALGRGGEPLGQMNASAPSGVTLKRYTTRDFVHWDEPIVVLFLPDGPLNGTSPSPSNDGTRWTVKSMARDDATGRYLLAAAYATFVYTFTSSDASKSNSFLPTSEKGNFDDHDDVNLWWSSASERWVDMQIIFQNHTDAGQPPGAPAGRKYCDNAGCTKRRVVTYRTSKDGIAWSGAAGCLAPPNATCWRPGQDPAIESCCVAYNVSALLQPDPTLDPPDVQFYRFRPFLVDAASGRIVSHMTLYAPVPEVMSTDPNYGYRTTETVPPGPPTLKCRTTSLRPGVPKACHAPHMYDEWLVLHHRSDVTSMRSWERLYRGHGYRRSPSGLPYASRASPHDVWLMAPPLVYAPKGESGEEPAAHIFVGSGAMWTVPLYRFGGLTAPANGEFSTPPFDATFTTSSGTSGGLPAASPSLSLSTQLWLNADASWRGAPITGGCDEGCAAYVMVELRDAASDAVLPGYDRAGCRLYNVSDTHIALKWESELALQTSVASSLQEQQLPTVTVKRVRARIFFRDAIVYALGEF
tara:strand:+ start:99 stop:1910 length:1812 start_codon:yes stop_codon:yes gene_type:complete